MRLASDGYLVRTLPVVFIPPGGSGLAMLVSRDTARPLHCLGECWELLPPDLSSVKTAEIRDLAHRSSALLPLRQQVPD